MKKTYYVALVPQGLPQEVISFLQGYIHEYRGQNHLLCSEISDLGYFLEMTILADSDKKKEWKVRIQTQYVLAVGEVGDSGNFPIGFLS